MSAGKTIQIYLPDGKPKSLKIAEIRTRIIQVILLPRGTLDFKKPREELDNAGVYFLIGDSDGNSKPLLYIGETEDCLTRLQQQHNAKDFWTTALVVVSSKANYFTKTRIKYLERFCYTEAKKAGRYQFDNSLKPSGTDISESMKVDLLDDFDTIKIIVSTLGFPLFDEIKKSDKKNILMCKGKEASAEGEYTEEGLVVFKGSSCNLSEAKTTIPSVIEMRKRLITEGILKQEGNILRFMSNHIFSSPSAAAGTVLARSANGWIEWKYKNGKTLDEVKRQ